jgi:hypothetical protein
MIAVLPNQLPRSHKGDRMSILTKVAGTHAGTGGAREFWLSRLLSGTPVYTTDDIPKVIDLAAELKTLDASTTLCIR